MAIVKNYYDIEIFNLFYQVISHHGRNKLKTFSCDKFCVLSEIALSITHSSKRKRLKKKNFTYNVRRVLLKFKI